MYPVTSFSVVPKGLLTLLSRLLVMKAGGLDALRYGASFLPWPSLETTLQPLCFTSESLGTVGWGAESGAWSWRLQCGVLCSTCLAGVGDRHVLFFPSSEK